jgi:hypothetical protein
LAKKHVAWPADHGSWVFLLSPLIIGLCAGRHWSTPCLYLIVAALGGFLLRQPLTIAVKVQAGRRSREDLPAALFWSLAYTSIAALHVLGLVIRGFAYLLYAAIPGVLVFSWYLWLVSRREERRQVWMEILATGVLALTAAAGYWVGRGSPEPAGWLLWVSTWAQSAASIVYVHLRIEQRKPLDEPSLRSRLNLGARALIFCSANLAVVLALSSSGVAPRWLFAAYALQFCECVWGALVPATGWRPARIGRRQLLVSALFTALYIVAWLRG